MADQPQTPPKVRPPGRRRRRVGHALQTLIGFTLGLCVMAAVGVYALIGQSIAVPGWVAERIETRVEEGLNGADLAFDDIEFVLRKGWRPRVRLQGMSLTGPDGQRILQLANAEASLAMRPLLRGKIQPKRIYVAGAVAVLRRDSTGKIELVFGNGTAPIRSAASIPALIESWDQALSLPQLTALTAVDLEGLTLRFEDLRIGRAWTLDGGQIRLDRDGDQVRAAASFSLLGGEATAGLVEANYSSRIGETRASFGISVQDIPAPDIAAQGPALNWLGVLRAPISGALRGGVDNAGQLGPLSATLQIGAGAIQPTAGTRPIRFEGARSYFTYAPDRQTLEFNEFAIDSSWGSLRAEGRAYLGGVEQGQLRDLVGQFTFSDMRLNPRGVYETPLVVDQTDVDLKLELNPFRLTLGQAVIHQGDALVRASGRVAGGPEGWRIAMDAQVPDLTPDQLVAAWPDRAAPKPRDWVQRNLSGGQLRDINVALRLEPGQAPDMAVDFDFEGVTTQFMRTMPPIQNAAGQATLIGRRFVVTASGGTVTPDEGGPVEIAGSSFIVPDTGIKQAAPGIVRLQAKGAVTSVMSLLNRPPIEVLKQTPLPVAFAEGQVSLAGTLSLPLKKKVDYDEIEFHFDGAIEGADSTVLVPGQRITAQALRVSGNQDGIEVSGRGQIGGVPATVRWSQPLGKGVSKASTLQGTIALSQDTVDTFNIGLPAGTVGGTGEGQFRVDLAPGVPPKLTLNSDLRGVSLRLPQVGWAKSAGTEGTLALAATLGGQQRVESLRVEGAGLSADGSVTIRPDGGLDRARFSRVRIGGWLDAPVDMVGRGDAPPSITILGGTVDMRRTDFGSSSTSSGGGSGGGASSPVSVTLDRLQVTDTIALTAFAGAFTTSGGMDGTFSGRVNGQTPVTGRIVPQGRRTAVRVLSDDAGGVFRSAGILQQGRGGAFDLTLLPASAEGQFDGTLRVTDTRVKDAPAIAALLNAISLVGLFDEMSGAGIQFTEVDAKFLLSPSQLRLTSSSAVGPSMGISMDGTYDVADARLNMRGVISPVYLLNSIGAFMTRKGEGLIGINYTLQGTASDPKVGVNPLSALTPGVFREIFRQGEPGVVSERAPTRPERDPTSPEWQGR